MSELPPIIGFIAGAASAGISKTIEAPIVRVKLLLQNQDASQQIGKDIKRYDGIMNCFTRVYREQGLLSFWRGNLPNVLRYFPIQALSFVFKDFYKRTFNPYDKNKESVKFFIGNMAAGGAAGASSLLCVYPLDFARTRLALDVGKAAPERQFRGFIDCLKIIFQKEGFRGLYRGLGISVVGIVLYRACYFGCFDTGKAKLFADPKSANLFQMWMFAQFVTLLSGIISYPLDTVRCRLMMQSGRKDPLYKGTLNCFKVIAQKEGIRGFFKGLSINIMRGAGGSIALILYSNFKK